MSAGAKKLDKDQYLFREGDPPDAMYVIKTGKLAVVKSKSNSEIVLAEMGPGSMVGEMAFFDSKPRSASVKALKESDVIVLPYKALHAQLAGMPEWTKAIMRTINDHLRSANVRLKELEKVPTGEDEVFPPSLITKLISILCFVAHHYGESTPEGVVVPSGTLRNYTIQVFQEATVKMQRLLTELAELKLATVESVGLEPATGISGEGKQRIVIPKLDQLFGFVEWYNEWLFKNADTRMNIKEVEIPTMKALLEYANKGTLDDKGNVKINLSEIQAHAERELGFPFKVEDTHGLVAAKLISEHTMNDGGGILAEFHKGDLEKTYSNWQIVYRLKNAKK